MPNWLGEINEKEERKNKNIFFCREKWTKRKIQNELEERKKNDKIYA